MGFPEIAADGKLYNSAVMFDREGNIALHERKRSLPGWNSIGELEPAVADTEGHSNDDSVNCWTARARENSVWYVACNRWGIEKHNAFLNLLY